MWRITDDHWDAWTFTHNPPTAEYPFGLRDEFDRIANGRLTSNPAAGPIPTCFLKAISARIPARTSPASPTTRHDEQRSEFTLWAISRSPLILGTNLTRLDDFTRSLITNKDVMDLNQQSVESGPGLLPRNRGDSASFPQRYWYARTGGTHPERYIAVFNLADAKTSSNLPWALFHLENKPHALYDVWDRKHVLSARTLHVVLPAHGCALFRVE